MAFKQTSPLSHAEYLLIKFPFIVIYPGTVTDEALAQDEERDEAPAQDVEVGRVEGEGEKVVGVDHIRAMKA